MPPLIDLLWLAEAAAAMVYGQHIKEPIFFWCGAFIAAFVIGG